MLQHIEEQYKNLEFGLAVSNLLKISVAIIPWILGFTLGLLVKMTRWIIAAAIAGYEAGK